MDHEITVSVNALCDYFVNDSNNLKKFNAPEILELDEFKTI